jgi:hypothetical protein
VDNLLGKIIDPMTIMGVFGRAPLELSSLRSTNSMPNISGSRNSRFRNSTENLELWANTIFFMELPKRCSKILVIDILMELR